MARPREFDIDTVVEAAMQVFWEKGYEGASLADLLDAMGIARGSLYKAFADKRALFLAALAHYDRTEVAGAVQVLTDGSRGGAERVARLFATVVDAVATRGDRRGCFLCNAAVDQAPHDADVERAVTAMMRRLDRAFAEALRDAGSGSDAARRARALTAAYMGLRVLAKTGVSARQLRETVATTLAEPGRRPA